MINQMIKLYANNLLEEVESGIKAIKAKRVVVDSVSIIELFIKDEYLSRAVLLTLVEKLKDFGVTAVFTGSVPEASEGLSGGGIIEYLVDTVVKMDFDPSLEEFKRTLNIRKMRRTDHSILIHPIEFSKLGIRVLEVK